MHLDFLPQATRPRRREEKMPQKPIYNIRRCRKCGNKTHKRHWENDICPVCGLACGYVESYHGGLSEAGIKEAKMKIAEGLQAVAN